MASSDKLWFELGVRDDVEKALKKDIQLAEELFKELTKVKKTPRGLIEAYSTNGLMDDKQRKAVDRMVSSANKYLGVLEKIRIQREKLKSTRSSASALGIDTKEIDKALRRLNGWQSYYKKIAEGKGVGSAKLATKLGPEFAERMQWINKLVASYTKLINTEEREATAATRALQQANQGLSASFDKVTEGAKRNMSTLAMLRQQAGYYFSLFGAKTLIQSVITTGGQFEYQETALKNIIGNAKQAKAIFSELKDLAVESPKTFMELTTTAKQLSAYQTPVNELYDTTKRLSDLSVGLGVDVNRLVLAYGQVRAASVLRGQELRQFTEAGIPIVQALADKFTQLNGRLTTTADVFKLISARAVPFEMVKEVLWEMTSEGGRFYNMQAEMADTLYGKWQKLADIWQITLGDLAKLNVGGFKPFNVLVDGLVFAARNLQKLLPVLSAFAMSKGLRALASTKVGMFSIKGLDANIAKAQQLFAIEQRRKFVNGEITPELYKQNLALNNEKTNYYMILAAEGKISNQLIHRLIAEKKITEAKIQQGIANGTLLEQEATQLRLLMQMNAQGKLGGWQGAMRGMGSGALSMMGGPTGVAMTYVGVWASIYASYEAWVSRIEERVQSAVDAAKQNAQEIGKTLETYNKLGAPQDRKDLRGRIEQMQQVLETSNLYSDTLRQQVEGAADLNKQYAILVEAMTKLKAQQEDVAHSQKEMTDAIMKTGGKHMGFWDWAQSIVLNPITNLPGFLADYAVQGASGNRGGVVGLFDFFFNDDINKNLEEYAEYLQEVETQMSLIAGYKSEYEAVMAEMSKDKDFQMLINGKEPQEALTAIAGSEYWDEFIEKMGDSGEEFRRVVEKMVDSAEDGQSELDKISKNDVPAMLESMAKARNMELEEYIRYCKKHPEEAERAVNRIISVLNVGGKALVGFANLLRSTLGLGPMGGGNGTTLGVYEQARRNETEEGRQALGKLINVAKGKGWGDKNGNGIWSSVWINNYFKKGGGYLEGLEGIRRAWNEMAEQRRAALAVGATLSAAEEAEWDRLDKAAEVFGLKEKKSKNFGGGKSGGKGSSKDTELEAVKNRVDLYKKFFSELDNASKQYGEKGALAHLKENGFEAVFDWKLSDVTNYGKSIDELTSSLANTTEARNKFLNDTNAAKVTQQRKDEAEALKDYISELSRMMDIMSENYKTYKKWVDLTGDTSLAARVAGVSENSSYSEWLAEKMNRALGGKGSAANVFGLDMETVKKDFGENSEVFKIWEQYRKNIEYMRKETLQLYEDAIKAAKSYDDKINDVNRDLGRTIGAILMMGGSPEEQDRLIAQAFVNSNKQKSKLAWEGFKEKNSLDLMLNNLGSMPVQELRRMIAAMRELRKNTEMNEEETRAWAEALKKLTDQEAIIDPLRSISALMGDYGGARSRRIAAEQAYKGAEKAGGKDVAQKRKAYYKALQEEALALDRVRSAVKAFSSTIGELGSALQSLGNAIGGKTGRIFSGVGGIFSGISKSMDAIANAKSGKGFDAIISRVTAVVTVISAMVEMNQQLSKALSTDRYEHYAKKAREINKMREAMDDYARSVARAKVEEDNWFGGNDLSRLKSGGDAAKKSLDAYYKELYEPQEIYKNKGSGLSKWGVPIAAGIGAIAGVVATAITGGAAGVAILGAMASLESVVGTVAATAIGGAIVGGIGAAVGQIAQNAVEGFTYKNGQTSARNNMRIQTRHKSFWRGQKTANLEEWVREKLGKELFDGEGLVNLEAAEQILEKYGDKLVGDTKETLERLVEIRKEYDEFIKQIQDYVGSIGTGLEDSMVDAIWDWLSEGEDAMDKFYEYASDTFRKLSQDIVKMFLKTVIFDKYSEQLEELFKGWSLGLYSDDQLISMMGIFSGAIANDLNEALPMAQNLTEMLDKTFEKYGYDIKNSNSKSSSASGGIKSITESTADLLASYINAIRADVSVNRVTLQQILIAVQTQNEMPAIATNQLRQLEMITLNTGQTASNTQAIAEIYAILKANTLGDNAFSIR